MKRKRLIAALAACLTFAGTAFAAPGEGELTEAEVAEITAAFEAVLAADAEAEMKALCERKACGEKAQCEKTGECNLECDCAPTGELFAYKLKKKPAAWKVVGPLATERFAAKSTSPEHKERILDLLAWAGGTHDAFVLTDELFAAEPQSFNREHLLVFSAYGHENVFAEVEKRAKKDVRCAAALAFKSGKKKATDYEAKEGHKLTGKKLLAKTAKAKFDPETLTDTLVAAAALKRHGHEEHWNRLQKRVHEEVIAALDDGATDRARGLALQAEFLYETLSGKDKGLSLSYLDSRLAFHQAARSGDVADADQVFELIESISPL